MFRRAAAFLSFALLAPMAWGFDQTPQERYEALVREFNEAQQRFSQLYQKAETDEERSKLFEETYPRPDTFAPRFLALAEEHPDDPAALEALIWIVQSNQMGEAVEQALDILMQHHIEDPKMARVCQSLRYTYSPKVEPLLREVLERNPDPKVRGQACFVLAQKLKQNAEMARRLADQPENRAQLEEFLGKATVATILEQGPEPFEREAEALFERTLADFGELEHYRGTLADAAETELFELRNLAIGKVAPEIEGEDIDGTPFKLSDYRGSVVAIVFWGTW